ncbi:hypothetical protein B0H66DRAFT_216825 [Apodospora peruviana]|uniref:F-box domain-containing protein n=1 Tax=Apodospora peruviana TaxID=516989 RepID=A0AAE0ID10_9PEZI|nr:hypothetical protein B0H66DRAFT_216825 [Apodospora peruviana]
MDSFGVVPPDIFLDILKLLPDIHSLQNLRCASPTVNRLLHEEGLAAEIVESVISSNLAYSTQLTVRLVTLLAWVPDGHSIFLESPDDLRDTLWEPHREKPSARAKHRDTVGRRSLRRYTGLPSEVIVRVVSLAGQVSVGWSEVNGLRRRCRHRRLVHDHDTELERGLGFGSLVVAIRQRRRARAGIQVGEQQLAVVLALEVLLSVVHLLRSAPSGLLGAPTMSSTIILCCPATSTNWLAAAYRCWCGSWLTVIPRERCSGLLPNSTVRLSPWSLVLPRSWLSLVLSAM